MAIANPVLGCRRRWTRHARFLGVALLLTGLSSCGPSEKTGKNSQTLVKPLNVLLITLDTTRADALGVYGQPLPTTPNIDRLARDGVIFRSAMSAAPITLPSHASIMTATYPFVHGARSNGQYVLSEQNVTLAEILQHNGYRTAAEIGSVVLNRRTGMNQGFGSYRDLDSPGIERVKPSEAVSGSDHAGLPERSAIDISRHGIEFLHKADSEPFFLWLHYFAPHAPYIPPERLRAEVGGDPYLGEVRYADREIGRVLTELDRLGLMDKTIIVITSDHGESRGDHGEVRHSFLVYDSTVHVPLIVHGPAKIGHGLQVNVVVRLIDIAPTILDLLRLPPMKNVQGVSLAPLLQAQSADLDLLAYGETSEPNKIFGSSILRFVRRGDWKYIHKVNPELYNVSADPMETRNLAGEQPARVAALHAQLSDIIAKAPTKIHSGQSRLDSQEADQLVALGYVTAGQGPGAKNSIENLDLKGPDPNQVVQDQSSFELLMDSWRTERSEASYEGIKALALRYPDSLPYVEAYLGISLQKKQYADVSKLVEQELARGKDLDAFWPSFMVEVSADIDVKDDAARAILKRLVEVDSCNAIVRSKLARSYELHGSPERKRDLLESALGRCDADWQLLNDLAYFYASTADESLRDGPRAVALAESAVASGGAESPAVLDTLAAAYVETGNFGKAADAMRKALAFLERSGAPKDIRAKYLRRLERIEENGTLAGSSGSSRGQKK